MELITGILLGGGIAYVTLLVKEQVDARQMARWQKWYASQDQNQSQPAPQAASPKVPVKANPQTETVVKPKQTSKPKPQPQPEPQMDESDDELDRLMSMVDDED